MTKTLVARVAWVQTLVTLVAFALVVLATWLAVRWMLVRQTDRALQDLLARTVDYLEAGPAGEQVDWQWLAGEIDTASEGHVEALGAQFTSNQRTIFIGTVQVPTGSRCQIARQGG